MSKSKKSGEAGFGSREIFNEWELLLLEFFGNSTLGLINKVTNSNYLAFNLKQAQFLK